jgi:hypothetical protein
MGDNPGVQGQIENKRVKTLIRTRRFLLFQIQAPARSLIGQNLRVAFPIFQAPLLSNSCISDPGMWQLGYFMDWPIVFPTLISPLSILRLNPQSGFEQTHAL